MLHVLQVLNLDSNPFFTGTVPTELRFLNLQIIKSLVAVGQTSPKLVPRFIPRDVQSILLPGSPSVVDIFATLRGMF